MNPYAINRKYETLDHIRIRIRRLTFRTKEFTWKIDLNNKGMKEMLRFKQFVKLTPAQRQALKQRSSNSKTGKISKDLEKAKQRERADR
jgi:hypothetical protein